MNRYVEELMEDEMGSTIEEHIEAEISTDDFCVDMLEDIEELKNKLNDTLNNDQQFLFDDYVTCMESVHKKIKKIAYLVGSKDTIMFMSGMNMFSGYTKN